MGSMGAHFPENIGLNLPHPFKPRSISIAFKIPAIATPG